MRVLILKTCAGDRFSVSAGQERELPDEVAKDLIRAGYAERIDLDDETPAETATIDRTQQEFAAPPPDKPRRRRWTPRKRKEQLSAKREDR